MPSGHIIAISKVVPPLTMHRLIIISSLALAFVGTMPSAESKPKKINDVYTAHFEYDFKKEEDVNKCISRASAALARNGLSRLLDSKVNDDGQYGYVYAWNSDRTAVAEITCDRKKKVSVLGYSRYASDTDLTFKSFKLLRDSNW